MRILLDSHVFVWAKSAPENLSDEARAAIINPDNEAFVSLASAWELWLKHSRNPVVELAPILDGGAHEFADALRKSGFALLEITLEHAAAAAKLPAIHRDPFDRMLIAQAIVEKLTIVTADPAFKKYPGLRVLRA